MFSIKAGVERRLAGKGNEEVLLEGPIHIHIIVIWI